MLRGGKAWTGDEHDAPWPGEETALCPGCLGEAATLESLYDRISKR